MNQDEGTNKWFPRIISAGLVILLLLGIGFGAVMWSFNRPPVNMKKLTAIGQGADREEVQRILGEPKGRYEDNRKWAYSKPFGWSIVYVHFDADGHYTGYEYDY